MLNFHNSMGGEYREIFTQIQTSWRIIALCPACVYIFVVEYELKNIWEKLVLELWNLREEEAPSPLPRVTS
ncbi:hypothetical protein Q6247_25375, partial [Klebsiella pneumoniae]